MPERASLISLFTGSGVTSLDEMRALYNEYGNGGDKNSDIADELKDIGLSMIPIYGSYREIKNFIENPSWKNAGLSALAIVSEIPMLKLAKATKLSKLTKLSRFSRVGKAVDGAPVVTRDISKGLKGVKNDRLLYHLDYGDNVGSFTNSGARIIDRKLVPGKSKVDGQLDYIWFNEGLPYSMGVNGKRMNRAIIVDKGNVDNLVRVRDSKIPIGQWDGNKGFVRNTEFVTSSQVNLGDAVVYNRRHVPVFGDYWVRSNLFSRGGEAEQIFDSITPSEKIAINLRGLDRRQIKNKAYGLADRYGLNDDIIGTRRQARIFNRTQKRHGMGVQEFASRVLSNKDDYSAAMVRKANFARNSAKWHGDGGDLNDNDPKDPYNSKDGWFRYWYENRPYQMIDAIDWHLDGTKDIDKARKAIYDSINNTNETYIGTVYNGNTYNGAMPVGLTDYFGENNGMARFALNASAYGYSLTPERDLIRSVNGLNIPDYRQTIYVLDPFTGIKKETLIHERSHNIPWFVKHKIKDNLFLNDGIDHDSYFDAPKEIYSRLNEFRFKNNLNPNKIYTEDDIKAFRESGALKQFYLDRYDDATIDYLLNNVASNNTVNNLPKNANYAAYGDDLRDTVYVPTDFSEAVDPNGTPEYTAEIVGSPYISLDIDKYNRRQIKRMA